MKTEKEEETEGGPEEEEETEGGPEEAAALLPCEHCDSTAPPLMLDVSPPSCFDCGQPQPLCVEQRIASIGPSGSAAAWGQAGGSGVVGAREEVVEHPHFDARRIRRRSNNDNGSLDSDPTSALLSQAADAASLHPALAVVVGLKRERPCSHSHGSVLAVVAMCQGCHGDRRMRLRFGRSRCLGAKCGCVCVS